MIKRNESDVWKIIFELQVQKDDKCFTLFLNFKYVFTSLQPDVRLNWSLNQNVASLMVKVVHIENLKLNFADMWLIPALIISHDTYYHIHTLLCIFKKMLEW